MQHAINEKFFIVFNMQNATGGMNRDCIAASPNASEYWKCGMVQVSVCKV